MTESHAHVPRVSAPYLRWQQVLDMFAAHTHVVAS